MRCNTSIRGFSTFELIAAIGLLIGVFAVVYYSSRPGAADAADCVMARWRASLGDAPLEPGARAPCSPRTGPLALDRAHTPELGDGEEFDDGAGGGGRFGRFTRSALSLVSASAALLPVRAARERPPAAPMGAEDFPVRAPRSEQAAPRAEKKRLADEIERYLAGRDAKTIATALDELGRGRPKTTDERPRFLLRVKDTLKRIGAVLDGDPRVFLALGPEQRSTLALLDATYARAKAVHAAAWVSLPAEAQELFRDPPAPVLPALIERSARLPAAGGGREPSVPLFAAAVEAYQAAAHSRDHGLVAALRPLGNFPVSQVLGTPDYHGLIAAGAPTREFITELGRANPEAVVELVERLAPQIDDSACYPASSAEPGRGSSVFETPAFQECGNALGVVAARAITALSGDAERVQGIFRSPALGSERLRRLAYDAAQPRRAFEAPGGPLRAITGRPEPLVGLLTVLSDRRFIGAGGSLADQGWTVFGQMFTAAVDGAIAELAKAQLHEQAHPNHQLLAGEIPAVREITRATIGMMSVDPQRFLAALRARQPADPVNRLSIFVAALHDGELLKQVYRARGEAPLIEGPQAPLAEFWNALFAHASPGVARAEHFLSGKAPNHANGKAGSMEAIAYFVGSAQGAHAMLRELIRQDAALRTEHESGSETFFKDVLPIGPALKAVFGEQIISANKTEVLERINDLTASLARQSKNIEARAIPSEADLAATRTMRSLIADSPSRSSTNLFASILARRYHPEKNLAAAHGQGFGGTEWNPPRPLSKQQAPSHEQAPTIPERIWERIRPLD